ncbi:MAG: TldD/PmbA family protein [Candidatus Tectomicrobia bacterium]|uniref:TldD/PmbA family protein n=1 Tax=Tectimicrobiota bacterium TaxID=2528274 RepID=A0A932CQD6_UNCTE|nr:TldD/PmbA family protein [Candidatus Tectomicrobia bacterium]
MDYSRRQFLRAVGLTAGAITVGNRLEGPFFSIQRLEAVPLTADELRVLADVALNQAKQLGCTYADIRINRYRHQQVSIRTSPDRAAGMLSGTVNHVPTVIESETFGFGVRVIHLGAWGFAASPRVEKDEIARVTAEAVAIAKANAPIRKRPVTLAPVPAYRDRYSTPIEKDPFDVPIEEKLGYLQQVNEAAKKVPGVMSVSSSMGFRSEYKYFASTEGSYLQQRIVQTVPSMSATAVDFTTRKSKTRNVQIMPVTGGYEHVERCGMLAQAGRVAAEAVEHLSAPSVEPGVKDLVLLPSHLALTIHESIGHSTELDRALGYEANFAGTSFLAPPEKVMGQFRFGSPLVNVVGDRTLPQALSTVGYDDDGVKATSWHIIQDGIFLAYQTIRDQAHLVGEKASRGCCYADSFDSIPFQRMPNVRLEPGPDGTTLDDLIGRVEDGILIDGRGSYSIDHQRYNFQFGGDAFWEIKKGRKGRMLANVAYQSKTQDFWNACAAIADQRFWQNYGVTDDGKGQPQQLSAISHGCAPSLFRRINVLRTE